MRVKEVLDQQLHAELVSIYDEMMWLAKRPNVSAGSARSWYTHVMSGTVALRLRYFTGKVSRSAAESETETLRLEHYKRIQTNLTGLVKRHRGFRQPRPEEFVRMLLEYERVHIVTFQENYAAMRAKGNYRKAGIELLPWRSLSPERQVSLWKKMLRGKVANASNYAPKALSGT